MGDGAVIEAQRLIGRDRVGGDSAATVPAYPCWMFRLPAGRAVDLVSVAKGRAARLDLPDGTTTICGITRN